MKKFLIIIMLMPELIWAGFVGFPITNQADVYTWYEFGDDYKPIAQIWAAGIEIAEIIGTDGWIIDSNNLEVYPYYRGGDETQRLFWFERDFVLDPTNDIDSAASDEKGDTIQTITNLCSETRLGAYLTGKIWTWLKVPNIYEKFVNTDEFADGTYSEYFAKTYEIINHPTAIPVYSRGSLFHAEGIGSTWDVKSNDFDFVTDADAAETIKPAGSVGWNLGLEYSYTDDGWIENRQANIDHGIELVGLHDETMMPVLHYISASGTYPPLSVTIAGQALAAGKGGLGVSDPNRPGDRNAENTTETVTISGEYTTLTKQWFRFNFSGDPDYEPEPNADNITISGAGALGDTILVEWIDTLPALYGDNDYFNKEQKSAQFRLYPVHLDEIYKVEKKLYHTFKTSKYPLHEVIWHANTNEDTPATSYHGDGYSYVSWELAKKAAETYIETNFTYNTPCGYTSCYKTSAPDTPSGYRWIAWMEYNSAYATVKIENTNIEHNVDFYIHTGLWNDGSGDYVFDANSETTLKENQYIMFSAHDNAGTNVKSRVIGETDMPNWCDEPVEAGYTERGYRTYSPQTKTNNGSSFVIIEWDKEYK